MDLLFLNMQRSKKLKFVIILSLFILELLSVFLTIKSFSNKEIVEIKEENKIKKEKFSMYIENDTGEYTEYTTSEYFPVGYNLNLDKSTCVDSNDNTLTGVLTGTNNSITVTSNKTMFCYLYFDKVSTAGEIFLESPTTGLNITMEGGLYRYQGTSVDNYICFGTSDKSTCTGNTDAYMYRIIGINSSGQLKLIKKESLNSSMQWYSSYSSNITWPNSTIYSNINGSSFLSNTTYVPSGWSSKISITSWKYGDNTTSNTTVANLYSTKNGWSSTVSAKIGLWYLHDYYYGLSGGNNCSSNYSTCVTSWIHLSNNDSGAPSTAEWTMSRYSGSSSYSAWDVRSKAVSLLTI